MATITQRTGTEGPRHDPYSFTEWTVTLAANREWHIHSGLICWVRLNGEDTPVANDDIDEALQRSGCPLSLRQIEKLYRRICEVPIRLHKAHGRPSWADGYPGGTLLFCPCGAVLDSNFNISAIE